MSIRRVVLLVAAAVVTATAWKEYPAVVRYLKIARM
jgi:hypothetical protein